MKPQKLLLYDEKGAGESLPALLIPCPICGAKKDLFCGMIPSRGFKRTRDPRVFFVHSLRARRGAAVHKARTGR